MDGSWRVVDCSAMKGTITGRPGRVLITPEDGVGAEIPLADIAVLMTGLETRLSSGLLVRLMNADVTVLVCDWQGVTRGSVLPWSNHTRVGARQIAQVEVSEPRRKALWANIVRAKIRGQAQVLELAASPKSARLKQIAKEVRSGDPSNCEGQAARAYWGALFGEGFTRMPGVGGYVNWALDYGYTILRGFGIRAVASAGLAPALGVFHRGRSNPFNLVDDVIEPFRPAVDAVVSESLANSDPGDREAKQALVALFDRPIDSSGTRLPASLTRMAQNIGQYFEGDIDRVIVPEWSGFESD